MLQAVRNSSVSELSFGYCEMIVLSYGKGTLYSQLSTRYMNAHHLLNLQESGLNIYSSNARKRCREHVFPVGKMSALLALSVQFSVEDQLR